MSKARRALGRVLVWQQPHPIYLAELVWRAHKDHETLERYKDIVFRRLTIWLHSSITIRSGCNMCWALAWRRLRKSIRIMSTIESDDGTWLLEMGARDRAAMARAIGNASR